MEEPQLQREVLGLKKDEYLTSAVDWEQRDVIQPSTDLFMIVDQPKLIWKTFNWDENNTFLRERVVKYDRKVGFLVGRDI